MPGIYKLEREIVIQMYGLGEISTERMKAQQAKSASRAGTASELKQR